MAAPARLIPDQPLKNTTAARETPIDSIHISIARIRPILRLQAGGEQGHYSPADNALWLHGRDFRLPLASILLYSGVSPLRGSFV